MTIARHSDAVLIAAWHSDLPMERISMDLDLSNSRIKACWRKLKVRGLLPDRDRVIERGAHPRPERHYVYPTRPTSKWETAIGELYVLHTRWKGREDALLEELLKHHNG